MKPKDVLLLLTDDWADWEAAHAIAEVNSVPQYTVKTIAVDKLSKTSIGGLRAEIDVSIEEYTDLNNLAMVILPGGFSWHQKRYGKIAAFINQVIAADVPIAAICGATIFLGSHGFLNQVRHTGDSKDFFKEYTEYEGEDLFVEAQVIRDKNMITANETAAVEFAYEIYKLLEIDTPEAIEDWYENFKHGFVR
ncbi:type 1 glutamine amidotransferase family protein [Desemzia incerta]|uniref:type 1 glutamine amidotransferase family protein n=1 Tax=Desemzia incerta TaxID=82801 RepID=UPI0016611014|nr:type 1 glutamine amidotransferase family protein [Desemzia incerta]